MTNFFDRAANRAAAARFSNLSWDFRQSPRKSRFGGAIRQTVATIATLRSLRKMGHNWDTGASSAGCNWSNSFLRIDIKLGNTARKMGHSMTELMAVEAGQC